MIRRGFWLTAGAVTGIYAYRRVSALGRRLSASLNPASPNPASLNPASPHRVGTNRDAKKPKAIGVARETLRFTRDVREGMQLYRARHPGAAGSTLSTDHESTIYEPEDVH